MEKDRRELEHSHLQSTRDMQERLAELEKSTKVRRFYFPRCMLPPSLSSGIK